MKDKQIAILIDGDNISPSYAEKIKEEAIKHGNIKIFRLYGSVNSPTVKSWYKTMPLQGIVPMLQISYASGKSIVDQALTIDTMDLLYSGDIDIFCIVSSDCDFTKLVYRLKESGKYVIGMGEKKTREALAKACDEFKILNLIYDMDEDDESEMVPAFVAIEDSKENETEEIISDNDSDDSSEVGLSLPDEHNIIEDITRFIEEDEEEKIYLSTVGIYLKRKYPGFDSRNYGHSNMTKLIEHHSAELKIVQEDAEDGIHKISYVMKK